MHDIKIRDSMCMALLCDQMNVAFADLRLQFTICDLLNVQYGYCTQWGNYFHYTPNQPLKNVKQLHVGFVVCVCV
jgi:hypothetical protein